MMCAPCSLARAFCSPSSILSPALLPVPLARETNKIARPSLTRFWAALRKPGHVSCILNTAGLRAGLGGPKTHETCRPGCSMCRATHKTLYWKVEPDRVLPYCSMSSGGALVLVLAAVPAGGGLVVACDLALLPSYICTGVLFRTLPSAKHVPRGSADSRQHAMKGKSHAQTRDMREGGVPHIVSPSDKSR